MANSSTERWAPAPEDEDLYDVIDLDEVLARFQQDAPGQVHEPHAVAAIGARIRYGRLSWWRRLTIRAPEGWRDQAKGPVA